MDLSQEMVLAEAATAAGFAPSIHNTQPWHWRVRPRALELWAARARQVVTDPVGRLLMVSCGTALNHAVVTLAAQGYVAHVARQPDPARPDHLATITVAEHVQVTPAAVRRYQAIAVRHTDRRPVTDRPVDPDALLALVTAVQSQGAYLHVLSRDQVVELAAAAGRAQRVEVEDEEFRAELAHWAGGLDDAACYAILYREDDGPPAWLRAGEALSAGWLAATEVGVSVLPLSAAVELVPTREALRRMLFGIGYPHLVLRLGHAEGQRGTRPTPRRPSSQTIESLPD
jgi:nitroreductase